jgi:phosphatidylserine/phosphatidylglycerophosphate/cardiolipin synthase-like enzyme
MTASRIAFVMLVAGFGCAPPAVEGPAGPEAARLIVGPDDGVEVMLEAVRGAERRVRVAMYLLTAPEAIGALVEARAAGRAVEVLLERAPYGTEDANEEAFAALAAAGVDVRWVAAPRGLLHAKLLLVDDAVAYVLTLNLTAAGLGANREYAIVDGAPADARRARAFWLDAALGGQDEAGAGADGSRLVTSPADARARLGAAIDGARVSIAVEMEELSDGDLAARLLAARARGVAVTVVAPAADRSAATSAVLHDLASAGIAVRALSSPAVHAKAMVVDGRQVYVGSVNFTRASLDDNREIGFLADDTTIAARLGAIITADATRGLPLY